LSRNVAFVSNLMEAGVEFEAVDFPQANRLTIHILAAVAEHEARMISERTRVALASAKARGRRLGGFRGRAGTKENCQKALQARRDKAATRAKDLSTTILKYREAGHYSYAQIADALNNDAITAPRGGQWSRTQVRRLLVQSSIENR
jgi:DNA invertase Pin-like site-specific DNA recombinase